MEILWHVVCQWWLMNGLGVWKEECSIAEIETDRDEGGDYRWQYYSILQKKKVKVII